MGRAVGITGSIFPLMATRIAARVKGDCLAWDVAGDAA